MYITKRKMPVKRENAVPAKGKSAVPAHTAALESRTGHWTQWIGPKGVAFISETLMPIHFVIKNRGPAPVFLMAEQGKQMDLPPYAVHATYARGTIWVKNQDEKLGALIEFDFLPIFHK